MISHYQYHQKTKHRPSSIWRAELPNSSQPVPNHCNKYKLPPQFMQEQLAYNYSYSIFKVSQLKEPFFWCSQPEVLTDKKLWPFQPHWFQLSPETMILDYSDQVKCLLACHKQLSCTGLCRIESLWLKWCYWYIKYKECFSFSETSPAKFYDYIHSF